jgi:hypothetical protein
LDSTVQAKLSLLFRPRATCKNALPLKENISTRSQNRSLGHARCGTTLAGRRGESSGSFAIDSAAVVMDVKKVHELVKVDVVELFAGDLVVELDDARREIRVRREW